MTDGDGDDDFVGVTVGVEAGVAERQLLKLMSACKMNHNTC